jgi:ParB/RepB/Spo0J family partition protein
LDQQSISENSEPGENQQDAPKPVAAPNMAALPLPFAFPRLRQLHRLEHEGPRDTGDVAPSIQQIDASNNSSEALRTPLPRSPFELGAGNNTGLDVFRHVPLADIIIGNRQRGVVEASVSKLMESIAERGLIHPLVVRPDPTDAHKFVLVSGMQRINAAKNLGNHEILCRVVALDESNAELWEVDENLARATLSPADEARFMARRREIYELRHGKGNGQAKGAAAANARQGRRHAAAMLARASFSEDTANQTGRSQRTIQRAIQRADQNGSATLTRVAGTALDTGAELDALPHLPPATREQLIEQAASGAQVSAVQARKQLRESPAANGLDTTEALPTPDLAAPESDSPDLSALKQAWLGASKSARESFLAWIELSK